MKLDNCTKQFIAAHLSDDIRTLSLQGDKYPNVDFKQAIIQIAGRQKIKDKLPSWYANPDLLFPAQLAIEQSSSELTARYKASLVKGDLLIDLTGGLGVDCTFFAKNFNKVSYFEQQTGLCAIAAHNFRQMQLPIEVTNADSILKIDQLPLCDCIYADPARRNKHGQKMASLSDCTPDIAELAPALLKKTKYLLLKLSPMLDISKALSELPAVKEIHIVAVENECKELLLLMTNEASNLQSFNSSNFQTERIAAAGSEPRYTCVNLKKNGKQDTFVFSQKEEISAVCAFAAKLEKYIYEPNASIFKAGAFRLAAQRFALKKLHLNSHLYTSDSLVKDFPGRSFECLAAFAPNRRNLKTCLSTINKANITIRNYPLSVNEIRKKTGLKEGGSDYIFATTLANGDAVFVLAKKITPSPSCPAGTK